MSMLFGLLAVAVAAVPAVAQDRLDAVAAAVDRATAPPAAETAAVERMAKFLNTTPAALRAERASTRLGWGDVFISHRIAVRGGHAVEKVVAARRTGAPWDSIAEEARVEVDAVVQDVAALWPDAARATPAGGGAARPAPSPPAGAKPPAPAATAAEEEKKGLGGRVLDFLRGSPAERSDPRDERPPDRPQDEIRDRMIRGGGTRR
jgi:hypothetical protein